MSTTDYQDRYTKHRANDALKGIFQKMFPNDGSLKACILDKNKGNTTNTLKSYFGDNCDILSPNTDKNVCSELTRKFGIKSPNCLVSQVLENPFDIYFLDYNHSWQGNPKAGSKACIPKNDIKKVLGKIKESSDAKFLAFSISSRGPKGSNSKDNRAEIIKLVKSTKRDFSIIRLSYNNVYTYFVIFPTEEQTDLKGKLAALFIQKRGEKYTDLWNGSLKNQDTQGLLPMKRFDLDANWGKRMISLRK